MPLIYNTNTVENLVYNSTDANYGFYNGTKVFEKHKELVLISQELLTSAGVVQTFGDYKTINWQSAHLANSANTTCYRAIDDAIVGNGNYIGLNSPPKFFSVDCTQYKTIEFTVNAEIWDTSCPNSVTCSELYIGLTRYSLSEDIISEIENGYALPNCCLMSGNMTLNYNGDYVYDYTGGLCVGNHYTSNFATGYIDISSLSGTYNLDCYFNIDNAGLCWADWAVYISDLRLYS